MPGIFLFLAGLFDWITEFFASRDWVLFAFLFSSFISAAVGCQMLWIWNQWRRKTEKSFEEAPAKISSTALWEKWKWGLYGCLGLTAATGTWYAIDEFLEALQGESLIAQFLPLAWWFVVVGGLMIASGWWKEKGKEKWRLRQEKSDLVRRSKIEEKARNLSKSMAHVLTYGVSGWKRIDNDLVSSDTLALSIENSLKYGTVTPGTIVRNHIAFNYGPYPQGEIKLGRLTFNKGMLPADHENAFLENEFDIGITTKMLSEHVYVLGRTGSGKSTLLQRLILQNIRLSSSHKVGCGVLAPDSDIFQSSLLPFIPKSRINDVVYLNPGDPKCVVSINPFVVHDYEDAETKAGKIYDLLGQIFNVDSKSTWAGLLRKCLRTLVYLPNSSLLDLKRLLTDPSYRVFASNQLEKHDRMLAKYWRVEHQTKPKNAGKPILDRIEVLIETKKVRDCLCGTHNVIDFREEMDAGKIVLMNVNKEMLPGDQGKVIGQVLVALIQFAAMSRENIPAKERRQWPFYVDEFDSYVTHNSSAFLEMFYRGRKFAVPLIIAHQNQSQLDASFLEGAGNVGTKIIMKTTSSDARRLSQDKFGDRVSLKAMPPGHGVFETTIGHYIKGAFSSDMISKELKSDFGVKDEIIKRSRSGLIVGTTDTENEPVFNESEEYQAPFEDATFIDVEETDTTTKQLPPAALEKENEPDEFDPADPFKQ